MKTIFKAAVLALAPMTAMALATAPAAAQSKTGIAIADLERAVGTSTAYTTARTQMNTTYKAQIDAVTARRTAIEADLKTKGEALQTATPALETQYQQYQAQTQTYQQELQRLSQPLTLANAYVEEQITAKLSDALKAAMTKTKVDLVLKPEATFSYQPTVDITAAVVTELNALVPSVGITPPAGWQPGGQRQAGQPAAAPANPNQKPTTR